ncbi:hypothetical protein HPB50_018480 [Hyalomma asiaticum]|uniref:Uncharacterized protein n=1 Tax=Hyalomma asiaticum TaxID=266040 RepID=A0ACB7TMJ2_HYAAI|nr:hypothetical protein HPB50_018480 [Hyalomma asiaticum]
MESGAAASSYPLHSWHPHVYAQPPKSPTPHSIAHILGIRDDTRNSDQPLNLSCPGRTTQPSSPGLAASPRASSAHDAKTAPSPLPALGTPSLPHADAQLALPKGEPIVTPGLERRAQHAAEAHSPAACRAAPTRARARAPTTGARRPAHRARSRLVAARPSPVHHNSSPLALRVVQRGFHPPKTSSACEGST